MSFILEKDYSVLITDDQLNQITTNQEDIDIAILQAEEEVKEYLRHRFDVEFDMRSFQIVSADAGITALKDDRIYQDASLKFYICSADATSEDLTDTDFFTEQDDRNQKLIQVTIDVFLYTIHSRLNPNNIPNNRKIRYDGDGDIEKAMSATKWLLMVQKGTVAPDLTPVLDEDGEQLKTGQSIQFGSSPRDGSRADLTDRYNNLTGN